MKQALIIFVKNKIAGKVKTRLAATIGEQAALHIYQQLLAHTHSAVENLKVDKFVFYADHLEEDIWTGADFKKQMQQGSDLGERMKNAFNNLFENGYEKALIIGTDCPGIEEEIIENAFAQLDNFDVIIGPAKDGGYYLLGMKKLLSFLFQNIKWSTRSVLKDTIAICKQHKLSYFLLPQLADIDVEKDLIYLKNSLALKQNTV